MKKQFCFCFCIFVDLIAPLTEVLTEVKWKWVCCWTPGCVARKKFRREQGAEPASEFYGLP